MTPSFPQICSNSVMIDFEIILLMPRMVNLTELFQHCHCSDKHPWQSAK
jgi:hypothetical protein